MAVKSRQARLRSEYASWYPNISLSIWFPVSVVVRKVTRQLVHGDSTLAPRWAASGRILDDRHFEFRGGEDRDAGLRTRAGDTTVWPAGTDEYYRPATPPTTPRQGRVPKNKHHG